MSKTSKQGRFWALQLILLLAWIGLWAAAGLLEYAPHASLWFPPAALTWAVFRVLGKRGAASVLPAAMIATLLADNLYQSQLPWQDLLTTGVLFTVAHSVPYYLGAVLAHRLAPPGPTRTVARAATVFLIVSFFASLLAAVGGALSLAQLGMISHDQALEIILPWWIGDLVGLIALGPFLIIGIERLMQYLDLPHPNVFRNLVGGETESAPRGRFLYKILVCLAMLALTMTGTWMVTDVEALAFLVYFVIFPQMWIAHSESSFRSMGSLAMISTTMALATWGLDLGQHALLYQFALLIVATSTYFGMAVPALNADNDALRQMLNFDSLTGATTRHHFLDRANQQLAHAKRYQEPISLIVIDVDRFKQFNDRGGHTLGDRVLTLLAATCLTQLRNSDVVGRIGGDEFCILLPNTSKATALETAERLRMAIESSAVDGLAENQLITGSFGVVEINPEQDTFNQAFERADRALYRAKNAGRNRVEAA